MTQQTKESGNGKSFIAVAQDREVDRFVILPETEKSDSNIDWYHAQNSDNTRSGLV